MEEIHIKAERRTALKAQSSRALENRLISFWADALRCRHCGLDRGYEPQIRPVGENYRVGGVVFAQINPGHIGVLTDKEIEERYKRSSSKLIASRKRESTEDLQRKQEDFIKNPCLPTWKQLNRAYLQAMRKLWGWPPGWYAKVIEQHGKGLDLDDIAIANLMQCPVRGNKYSAKEIHACWAERTQTLLQILRPGIIVAQGKTVYEHLGNLLLPNNPTLLRGVHHASRESKAVQDMFLKEVKKKIRSC
jgi:hypothetical protein